MRVSVKVKVSAGRSEVASADDGSLVVHLRAAPERGKANAELVRLLADHYDVAQSAVRVVTGTTSRSKTVQIDENP